MLKTIIKSVAVTAGIAVTLTSGAFAQTYISDTTFAKVPFRVNVDATITAVQGDDTISKAVTGKTTGADTLKIPLEITITTAVRDAGKAQGRLNAPTITGTRGNITLRLPAQSYSNAEVALHSVNGKRILRGKADAKDAVSGISRRNIAAGVYLLSVKGNNGTFTTRLTHSGGKININVAFGAESVSHARKMGKMAANGEWGMDWEITISPAYTKRYEDSTYTLNITEVALQDIAMREKPLSEDEFIDARDGTIYKKVEIGEQTWMAENLNYDIPNVTSDRCYKYSADSCAKYGRLYVWGTAMGLEGSYYGTVWGGSDVNHQGVCPAGWHLPSNAEWTQLTSFVGGTSTAGRKLKSTSGWDSNGNSTDEYGFSALPGGYGNPDGFFSSGYVGFWWSATEFNANTAYENQCYYSNEIVKVDYSPKDNMFSVRCVQDVE